MSDDGCSCNEIACAYVDAQRQHEWKPGSESRVGFAVVQEESVLEGRCVSSTS